MSHSILLSEQRMLRATSLAVARGRALLGRRCLCSAAEYAVAPYRNMARMTAQQRDAFAAADVLLHQKMRELVPAALAHNGEEAFDAHLVGVQSVLRSWDAPEHLCNAALFHSIYGTEGFQGFKLPLTHRDEISQLIGADAERLAWIFCMVDRASVDVTVLAPQADNAPPSFFARAELGGFRIRLQSEQEWIDFLTLSLADWLEQVSPGAICAYIPPTCTSLDQRLCRARSLSCARSLLLSLALSLPPSLPPSPLVW